MRIGRATNGHSCEWEMQLKMCEWLNHNKILFKDEIRVSEIGRIADFILLINGNQLVNIEAKCNAFDCLLKQLDDHAIYCDYSFAFITDVCLTPKWFKLKLIDKGYGLIVYNTTGQTITEVLEAHSNKPRQKNIRHKVASIIRGNAEDKSQINLYRGGK